MRPSRHHRAGRFSRRDNGLGTGGTPAGGQQQQQNQGGTGQQQPQSQGPNDPIQPQQPGTGSASSGTGGQQGNPDGNQPENFDQYRTNAEGRITTLMRQRDEATRLLEEERRKGLTPEELQRLRALDEKDKQRDAREKNLILRYEIASRAPRLGIVDPEVAVLLLERNANVSVGDDGTVTGLDEALKALIKDKPHLVRATTQPVDAGAGTGGQRTGGGKTTMNDIIRGAARGKAITQAGE